MNEIEQTLVLIADDDPGIRAIVRRMLSRDHYIIEEAEDGEQALAKFQEFHPTILLLDAMMPGLDGFEVCQRLRSLPNAELCAVLMITSLNNEEAITRAFDAGATDYIAKPVQWSVLRQRVRRMTNEICAQEALKRAHAQLEERVVLRTAELEAMNRVLEREIIDRKRAEEAVRLYADAVRSMHIGLQVWQLEDSVDSRSFRLIAVNPAAARMAGSPPETVLGKHISEVLPSFLNPMVIDDYREVALTGQTKDLGAVQHGDSSLPVSTYTVTAFALPNHCVGVTFDDITARKRTEDALYQSEQKLRRITDNMLDIICQTDLQGTIEFATPSCLDVLGYTPDDMCGRSIYELVHPDDINLVRDAIQTRGRIEYRYRHAEGHYLWLETLSNFLFEGRAIPTGIMFASRDITKRKRAERELEELNRLKTEFLTTAAHELRTPLTSIRGFSEILIKRDLLPDRRTKYLELINVQAEQLGALIDDLLDVSRLEAKRGLSIVPEPFDVGELIKQVTMPLAENAQQHHIEYADFSDLPEVMGDPARVSQVIKNLVTNAIKYSPNGGQVNINARTTDSFMELSVADQGIGMTPEQIEHLFEKFYRADASNNAIGGTGLGLAISKLIVELHRGKIWVRSQIGIGTTVYFTLPLARDNNIETSGNPDNVA